MLTNSIELLKDARKNKYAIPAPNFFDIDSARSYISVAEKVKQPIILSFAEAHSRILPLEEAALIGKYFAKKSSVPVVLHLDHGEHEEFLERAIELGFSSIMMDASYDNFEENIKRTQKMANYAHAHGISIEAEIGHVASSERIDFEDTTDNIYTSPNSAIEFVERTQVDSLAVSIGTSHGNYKGKPNIDFQLLKEISNSVSIPLVLHGGSSTGEENLRTCISNGINKINIFTDFCNAITSVIDSKNGLKFFEMKMQSNKAMEDVLEQFYNVCQTGRN